MANALQVMDDDEDVIDQKEADAKVLSDLLARMKAITGRLEAEANKRVGRRAPIEKRWIEDLEQFHGRYDSTTAANLASGTKSKLFINLTRPKTEAMSARLSDLLFPTDDKNWGIQPTPVPELSDQSKAAAKAARASQVALDDFTEAMEATPPGPEQQEAAQGQMAALTEANNAAQAETLRLEEKVGEARKRSERMSLEIADQLTESAYHAAMRDVIDDATKLGTGISKGPVTGDRIRKGWKQDAQGKFSLVMSEGDQPAIRYVNPWDYFPDMDARKAGEGEGDLERHLMNNDQLRQLAKLPGFEKDAVRRLLQYGPTSYAPSYLTQLRAMNDSNDAIASRMYHVWEFSGPLEAEDIRDLAMAVGEDDTAQEMAEIDPLEVVKAVVWFCQGEVLKFAIYPYDSGESMYSIFSLVKDEASAFGYGIPAIMRDPQRALNAGWRAMMDNGGLSTGPQVVVATDLIEPADGVWELTPRKVWRAKGGIPHDKRAFDAFTIPSAQVELAGIIQLAKQFIDDMTAMPALAQGEQGTGVTKTAQGMALLMNSANVVFRRIVKNFDDDMTVPNIRRFYDWNMQFSKIEEIKGDYQIDARGSSVLLVREMQAQNLMTLAFQLGGHPVYGVMLKNRDMLKKLFQANMIPADEVLLSDEEIDVALAKAAADMKAQQEAAGPTVEDPAIAQQAKAEEHQYKMELVKLEGETRLAIAHANRDTQLMIMAEKLNISVDQARSKLDVEREKLGSSERKFAAELAQTVRTGPSGGGNF